jgi:hypothetical protein
MAGVDSVSPESTHLFQVHKIVETEEKGIHVKLSFSNMADRASLPSGELKHQSPCLRKPRQPGTQIEEATLVEFI